MKRKEESNTEKYTSAGTDIEEVKRLNENSGMSYNEAKEWLAKSTGGYNTSVYSDTDIEEVRRNNQGIQNENE
ncbi:gamma-type small acid-soluble spore protein [Oceanobacillus sp. J11TS1]|uniref:gamma-type small acid-soluble spore protein n=1 Tax=Oceanobacillus sp. J11TS1 TaxID=2807191 RepID=UPI001B09B308|nr:gamma-type small acid-soluble spore protein [Oceanobacillus sp. J11TS1]GIO22117.1 hypothetical protein J11TS1_06980 [Oceanobacillus sp. J11TS1]